MGAISFLGIIIGLIGLALSALVVYALILFIRFANKAIPALDIYLHEKAQNK